MDMRVEGTPPAGAVGSAGDRDNRDAATERVIILGGGIAGLAAALRLRTAAPDIDVRLVEQGHRLGGKLQTERVDGFVMEGTADSFLSSKPEGLQLARQLGIEGRLQGARAETRRTFILRDGQLVKLPEGLSGLVPARLGPLFRSPLLSFQGKLRVALEYVIPGRRDGDESLGSFMRRRMGNEAYERLIEPLMSGIYGGNGDELSLDATFPRLRDLERSHGSVLRGLRATAGTSRPTTQSPPPSPFVTPIGGMAELVEAIEQHLGGVRVVRGCPATAIRRVDRGYAVRLDSGEEIKGDAVVAATPAYATADLVSRLDPELAGLLANIPYASSATVSLAYPEGDLSRPLDGHGYIIPRREGIPVLACTWTSSKFANRAPAGYVLLRGFVGRAGGETYLDCTDEDLAALVRSELRDRQGITAPPIITRVFRWPRAMPQYRVGHVELVASIERRLGHHRGLLLAGAAYRGVGIPDCIRSGQEAADRATLLLRRGQQ